MPSFTYRELETMFNLLKTSGNVKETPHSHAQTIICQMELAEKNFNVVLSATKRFKLKRDKFRSARPKMPTQQEVDEIFLVIPDDNLEGDHDSVEEDQDSVADDQDGVSKGPVKHSGDGSNKAYCVLLHDLERRQKYRRTAPIIEYLKDEAVRNKVTVHELIGVILKQMDYHGDRRSSSSTIAETLLQGGTVNLMPMLPTCYLQQNLQLGRTGYTVLKNTLKETVSQEMPSWKKVRQYQKSITPMRTDTHLPGERFHYADALRTTLSRILDAYGSDSMGHSLICEFKDGVDGSGSHAIYHQQHNEKTNNIIIFMFSILRVVDENTGVIVFEEKLVASPFAIRPVYLVLGKEVLGNLEDVKQTVKERQELAEHGLVVDSRYGPRSMQLKASLSMIDGKMRGLVTG